jgi:[acyl-carrier-protein] S-malonyltransferase
MKIAILFPGQGSQFIGMGQEFVKSDSSCSSILKMAESACDLPLGDIIQNGPMERLTQANHLQPAITVTNLICWQALQNSLPEGVSVHCFAGHSLGEYSALHAAGVLSAEDTMRLVAKRGAVMDREGQKNPGGMRAILGLKIDEVEDIIENYNGDGCVTAANHNCEQQIVISGSTEAVDAVGEMATEKGAKVIALAVTVANHSPLVAGAVPDFKEFMSGIEFRAPGTPVFFNVSAAKETDTATIKEMMERQIISRVRWYEIISAMLKEGVDTFIEVGPKPVLKGMMRKIVPKDLKYKALQFDSPAALEKVIKEIS